MQRPASAEVRRPRLGLEIIGGLKLLRGAFFIAVGFGLLRLLHHDLYMFALQVVEALRIDPERMTVSRLLDKVALLSAHRVKQLSALIFVYAAVDWIEGTGLILRKAWAEYLTLILTLALLPLEAYRLLRQPNLWIALIFLANILIAIYLVWALRQQHRARLNSIILS
jgi:uncharacterized membrane protein (DUF2068 family)